MPRRSILSAAERDSLLAVPETQEELIRLYTFKEEDLSLIRQRRGDANRLGVALQLCLLRYPGQELAVDSMPPAPLIQWVGKQVRIDSKHWADYGARAATRREHLLELREYLGLTPFGLTHYRQALRFATAHALQTDKGVVLANYLLDSLRKSAVIVPSLDVIERLCSEALTRANRSIYSTLTEALTLEHLQRLDRLLRVRPDSHMTELAWLRQSPVKPTSRHMLEHIERLKVLQGLNLPEGMERLVHQNRLLKIAREGSQMTPNDLAKFEQQRRHATLAAQVLERRATVTDEIIDLHDRIMGRIFNAAKNKHHQQFQAAGKAINDKVRLYAMVGQALLEARESGTDAFAAIEDVMSWRAFKVSVAEAQKLAQPGDFESGLKITPLDAAVPDAAQALIDRAAKMLPHLRITELLMEVDSWTGFTRHFTHLKTGDTSRDTRLLLILADAINLGLNKMAESCPGTTYAKLSWLQGWHIRDETYALALAQLVNAQFREPLAEHWGRWNHVVVGRAAVSCGWESRKHGAHQSEVRRRTRAAVLHARLGSIRAVQFESRERRRARLHVRARRASLP